MLPGSFKMGKFLTGHQKLARLQKLRRAKSELKGCSKNEKPIRAIVVKKEYKPYEDKTLSYFISTSETLFKPSVKKIKVRGERQTSLGERGAKCLPRLLCLVRENNNRFLHANIFFVSVHYFVSRFNNMKNSKIRQKANKKLPDGYWENMPASVMFVKAMAISGEPVGTEIYERALTEGGEKYFPEEFEFRRKWALIPQEVKDAYNSDPNSTWPLFEKYDDAPNEIQNWPGIVAATDHDWEVSHKWYNSDTYKAKRLAKAHLQVQTYNDYFGKYGVTKKLEDFI